jgi:hypothetical protein
LALEINISLPIPLKGGDFQGGLKIFPMGRRRYQNSPRQWTAAPVRWCSRRSARWVTRETMSFILSSSCRQTIDLVAEFGKLDRHMPAKPADPIIKNLS